MATTGPILRRRRSYRSFLGLYVLAGILVATIALAVIYGRPFRFLRRSRPATA